MPNGHLTHRSNVPFLTDTQARRRFIDLIGIIVKDNILTVISLKNYHETNKCYKSWYYLSQLLWASQLDVLHNTYPIQYSQFLNVLCVNVNSRLEHLFSKYPFIISLPSRIHIQSLFICGKLCNYLQLYNVLDQHYRTFLMHLFTIVVSPTINLFNVYFITVILLLVNT